MTLTRETNLQGLTVLAASGSFVLNVFPATFSAETLNTYVGPHRDDQAFSELVEAQQDWTAWRDTDDGARVYIWCHVPDATFEWPRFQPATVSLPESPPLFCRVMLDGLNRHLLSKGFTRIGRDRPGPVSYVNWSVGNFLDGLDLAGFAPDPRVGMFPKIVLQSFTTRFGQAAPLINLTVDVAYTTRMEIPADELLEQGFDVCGRYVKLLPGAGGLETLEGLTIGRVAKVVGWDLLLEDVRPGAPERIPGAWCVLEPGRRTIEDYLRHAHPKHFRAIHLAMGAWVSQVISPPEKLRLIEGFVKHRLGGLDQQQIPLADELSVCFGAPREPSAGAETFRAMSLLSPTFSFDPESPKLHSSPDGGLKQYGPYSRSRMHAAKPRVLVLAPDMFKGQVEQFIDQFRSGIRGCEPTYNGFAKKYRLDGVEIVPRYFPWRNGAAKDVYYNATIDALASLKGTGGSRRSQVQAAGLLGLQSSCRTVSSCWSAASRRDGNSDR